MLKMYHFEAIVTNHNQFPVNGSYRRSSRRNSYQLSNRIISNTAESDPRGYELRRSAETNGRYNQKTYGPRERSIMRFRRKNEFMRAPLMQAERPVGSLRSLR